MACDEGWPGYGLPTRLPPGCGYARWHDGAGEASPAGATVEPAPPPQTVADVAAPQLIKEGSKGPITADFALVRAVAVRDGLPGPEVWLVLRRNPETGELKAYLSNAPAAAALVTLVRLSGMRWPIERCFEGPLRLFALRHPEPTERHPLRRQRRIIRADTGQE